MSDAKEEDAEGVAGEAMEPDQPLQNFGNKLTCTLEGGYGTLCKRLDLMVFDFFSSIYML